HTLQSNAIYNNTGLGIDLGSPGGQANDPLDADTGPNDLQNYPVLSLVSTSAHRVTILGSLASKPNQTYTLQFFRTAIWHGPEGETLIGTTTVRTTAAGTTAIYASFPVTVPAGTYVTATATNPAGNTSEFTAQQVVPTPIPYSSANERFIYQ